MKRIIAFFLCVTMLVTVALSITPLTVAAEETGLLSDFENEVYNGFWWNNATYGILGNTGTPASVDKEENGNHYLLMPTGTANYARYYYEAPVTAGKTYCLRLRYKGNGFGMNIQSCSEGGGLVWAPATTEWTNYQRIFTVANPMTAGSSYFFVFWNKTGGTDVCIDDVYLTEVVDTQSIAFAEGSQLTMAKGDTKTLTVVAQPDGAMITDAVTYTSNNPAVTVSASGVLTAVAPGVATITATADGFSTTCTVTVDRYAPMLLGDFEGTLSSSWAWDNASYGIINDSSSITTYTENGNTFLKIAPKVKADGTGNESYYRTYQNFPVEAGRTYRITMKYKGSGADLYLLSNGIATGSGAFAFTSTDKWTTISKVFTAKTPTNVNFSFGFRHTGATNDITYVDDVYLEEVAPFDEFVIDGNFETEALSSQWSQFVSNANATIVPDEVSDGQCMQISGKTWPYMQEMGAMRAGYSYKLNFKLRGNGRAIFYFHTAEEAAKKVYGVTSDKYTISGKYVYITADSDTEWTECSIIFTLLTSNSGYNISFGSYNDSGYVFFDDISLTEIGNAYIQEGLVGGSITMTADGTTAPLLSGLNNGKEGLPVTVTVTPTAGYILIPGSLRYTTSAGITSRILNKDSGDFGEGAGNTFAFTAPAENVKLTADFAPTANTDFAFGTVGTAVHINQQGETDGIRFLNRVQLTSFDDTTDSYTVSYQGETYNVAEIGMLLKRANLHYTLDVETYDRLLHDTGADVVKMWGIKVYNRDTNTFRAVDYTDTYVDFSIALVTSNPDMAFCERLYTARSYVILEKDGLKTVIYGNERTDSINTTLARADGTLSDDVTVDNSHVGDIDQSTPIPEDDLDNADLKILNIGNSYGHNSTSYIADIAALEGKTLKVVNLFKSGCTFQSHYEGYVNNIPQYWYELGGVIDWKSAVTMKAALLSDDWDIVTINGMPQTAESGCRPYLDELYSIIKKACPNAKTYLMQNWAYGDDYAYFNDQTGGTRKEMWDKVLPLSETVSAAIDVPLIPCGTAMNAMENWFEANRPDLSVYQEDDAHAEETWGWYLLALVWYRTLVGETPGNTFADFKKDCTDDADVRAAVHEIAMAAVESYYPAN